MGAQDPTAGAAGRDGAEPGPDELTAALEEHVDRDGGVRSGVASRLRAERGWSGRLLDILDIFSRSTERLGYMAGGRRPGEVVTWLTIWSESPLTVEEIDLIAEAGGWDPEPFVVLSRAGLLDALLRTPDGSIRHVRGERAGGWVSDSLTTAGEAEVLAAARRVIDGDATPG